MADWAAHYYELSVEQFNNPKPKSPKPAQKTCNVDTDSTCAAHFERLVEKVCDYSCNEENGITEKLIRDNIDMDRLSFRGGNLNAYLKEGADPRLVERH